MDKTYNQMVDERLATDSPEVFRNFTQENAKHIVPAFIRSARQSITILGGSMPDEFYSDSTCDTSGREISRDGSKTSPNVFVSLFEAAERLAETLRDDGKIPIRIITLNSKDNEKIDAFVERTNHSVGKQVIKIIHARYTGHRGINHYLVVDHKRYRLEEPHQPFGDNPPDILKAEVCCNGPIKAQKLEASFDSIWCKLNKDEEEKQHD